MRVIDPDSPEAGWEPFMEWLRGHGFDPGDVRRVVLDPEVPNRRGPGQGYVIGGPVVEGEQHPIVASSTNCMARVELFVRDAYGDRIFDYGTESICTYWRTGRMSAPPRPRPLVATSAFPPDDQS